MPQVLEIPSAGGPTVPGYEPPSRREINLSRMVREAYSAGANKRALLSKIESSNLPPGCCPCKGQKGQPLPFDQTPYTEPAGLGQPKRPQKPFQPVPGPCTPVEEALKRIGLTPAMLRDCIRGQPFRSAAQKVRARKKQVEIPKRRRTRTPAGQAALRQRYPKKPKGSVPGRKMGGTYRLLSNGTCWDTRTRRFVKRVNCQ